MFAQIVPLVRAGRYLAPTLTYRFPAEALADLFVGSLIRVPLRNQKATGVIIEILSENTTDLSDSKIKTVDPFTPSVQFSPLQMEWVAWIQKTYHATPSQAWRLMVPVALQKARKTRTPSPFQGVIQNSPEGEDHDLRLQGNFRKPTVLQSLPGVRPLEYFKKIVKKTIEEGRQALWLVPEKSAIPLAIDCFKKSLGDRIAIFHSGLTEAEEGREWWKIYSGHASLVVGTRSALFAPIRHLGCVLIEDEHAWTYQEEQAPYYNAPTAAAALAELHKARLVLSSATPRAESFYKTAVTKEWEWVSVGTRHALSLQTPKIHVVDMREELQKRNFGIFSMPLQKKLSECLEQKEQAILFVNLRGVAGAILCRDCGAGVRCPKCDISLTHHRDKGGILLCHQCGYTEPLPALCPRCRSPRIKSVGLGTERVEQEAKKLFPSARVLRVDQDTSEGENPHLLLQDYDILVGTQKIAGSKPVALVGMVLADIGIHAPDFRSSERTFQQIMTMAGLCKKSGELIVQTYAPELPAIRFAAEYRYEDFMNQELEFRKQWKRSPY
ncbi:primosomal protein N' [Candidatus Peregrinibacteria bacterium]|nr:primosomal protein N' [Candidatus Peregrinibacteria bacterium]